MILRITSEQKQLLTQKVHFTNTGKQLGFVSSTEMKTWLLMFDHANQVMLLISIIDKCKCASEYTYTQCSEYILSIIMYSNQFMSEQMREGDSESEWASEC